MQFFAVRIALFAIRNEFFTIRTASESVVLIALRVVQCSVLGRETAICGALMRFRKFFARRKAGRTAKSMASGRGWIVISFVSFVVLEKAFGSWCVVFPTAPRPRSFAARGAHRFC
jgi:hypothetical protein